MVFDEMNGSGNVLDRLIDRVRVVYVNILTMRNLVGYDNGKSEADNHRQQMQKWVL